MIAAVGVLVDHDRDVVRGCLANFQPDEAAVLDGHLGRPVGWIAALMAEGSNVWFVASVDDAVMTERLRRGAVAVSIEAEGLHVTPAPDEPAHVIRSLVPVTSYRGTRGRSGWTLLAIAALRDDDAPARAGSAMWAIV